MCSITGEFATAGTYLATMPRALASERTSVTRDSFPYPNHSTFFASRRTALTGHRKRVLLGGEECLPFASALFLPDRVGNRGRQQQPLGVGIARM